MRILLSNDDGYLATGLRTLAEHLADLAQVTIVAPDRNRSGASNSLTLDSPLRVERAENDVYYVTGTPTDCVHIAITGLLAQPPDMEPNQIGPAITALKERSVALRRYL